MQIKTLPDLTEMVVQFRDERDWKQYHNPKDVAISLSLEVAELLELMQWRTGEALDSHLLDNSVAVSEELADILYWVLLLAHDLNIDLTGAFVAKMRTNAAKYPVDKAKGSSRKYTEL